MSETTPDRAGAQDMIAAPDITGRLSSIQLLDLMLFLEEQLGTPIRPEDLTTANFDTIEAIEALLDRYQVESSEAGPRGA